MEGNSNNADMQNAPENQSLLDAGGPIPVSDANRLIDRFIQSQPVLANAKAVLGHFPAAKDFVEVFSQKNAFIFDIGLINRFHSDGELTHFLVCLGNDNGSPTVLVAGCKVINPQSSNPVFITSQKITDPVSEHPPKTVITNFQKDGGSGTISFTLK